MEMSARLCKQVEEMFLRFGIKSVSMDDISRELGISKKTLYQFVPNKRELVGMILSRVMKDEEAQCVLCSDDAENSIHEMVLICIHVTQQLKKMSSNTIYDLSKYYNEQWQTFETARDEMIRIALRSNLQKGIEEGLYRDDIDVELLTMLYLHMGTYITDHKIAANPQSSRVKLYIEFIRYHIRGIATSKGMKILSQYEHLLKE